MDQQIFWKQTLARPKRRLAPVENVLASSSFTNRTWRPALGAVAVSVVAVGLASWWGASGGGAGGGVHGDTRSSESASTGQGSQGDRDAGHHVAADVAKDADVPERATVSEAVARSEMAAAQADASRGKHGEAQPQCMHRAHGRGRLYTALLHALSAR